MKRKRLTDLSLDFVSAVDRPAQEPATVSILKRKGAPVKALPKTTEDATAFIGRLLDEGKIPEIAKAAEVKKATILTTEYDGHTHLVWTGRYDGSEEKAGSTSWTDEHNHPWIRDNDGSIVIGAADGHTHEVDIITKTAPAEEAAPMDPKKTPEELATEKAAKITALEAELAKSRKLAELTDAHKAHFATLEGDAASAFLAKSADERNDILKAATLADDVVYKSTDGTEFRKSDDPRLVKMAKDRDEDRLTLAKERDARRTAEYAKRAGELVNLTGDEPVKVALLKAVDEITDPELRGKVVETLKAANDSLVPAFETRGTRESGTTGSGDPHAKIEALAREHAKSANVSFEKAYTAVLDTPEGKELYTQHVEANPTL